MLEVEFNVISPDMTIIVFGLLTIINHVYFKHNRKQLHQKAV